MMLKTRSVRTTVSLDDDVAAAVERLRREEGLGLSEALNALARRGMVAPSRPKGFTQRSYALGLKVDISNIGEVLDALDDPR
jgi:hypothetical protein